MTGAVLPLYFCCCICYKYYMIGFLKGEFIMKKVFCNHILFGGFIWLRQE